MEFNTYGMNYYDYLIMENKINYDVSLIFINYIKNIKLIFQ